MRSAHAWVESRLGSAVAHAESMAGGAGQRQYWRLRLADGRRVVLMHARPERTEILPPALRRERDELPFLTVTRLLAAHGLPVPEIYAADSEARRVALEDLGDVHLADLAPDARGPRRRETIDLLARVHAIPVPPIEERSLPFDRDFDREWIRFELELFRREVKVSDELDHALDALAEQVESLPRSLALRDVQSQNLMIDATGALRILDYQDALLAPPELDLASFLWDSYTDLDPAERAALLGRYAAARGAAVDERALALLVVQRKCKDWSRFRSLVARGEPQFATAAQRAARSIETALERLGDDVVAPAVARALRGA